MTEQPDLQKGIDLTEVMAAVAKLNNEAPPSGPVIVPVSAFPVMAEEIKRKEAAKTAKTAEVEKAAEAAKAAVFANTGYRIGDRAADGWVCAGQSATGRPFFAAPEDSGVMKPEKAKKVIASLRKKGCPGARLPSHGELKQMFNYDALIGGFKNINSGGWYAFDQFGAYRINNGKGDGIKNVKKFSIRLVRDFAP